MILDLLAELRKNCIGIEGNDGEFLGPAIDNIIDLATSLHNDSDIERWKKAEHELSWVGKQDMGG